MNVMHQPVIPAIGAATQGGYFVGCILDDASLFGIVVAPKALGESAEMAWNEKKKNLVGAASYSDGMANTVAMAKAGSVLAKWARDLTIGGLDDWYIPARDELELVYRHLKPGTSKNHSFRSGDNPSSSPTGYPYTAAAPRQTLIDTFRKDCAEAMNEDWYWTSTQSAGAEQYAWFQYFILGHQDGSLKSALLRARAVRRFPI